MLDIPVGRRKLFDYTLFFEKPFDIPTSGYAVTQKSVLQELNPGCETQNKIVASISKNHKFQIWNKYYAGHSCGPKKGVWLHSFLWKAIRYYNLWMRRDPKISFARIESRLWDAKWNCSLY